MKEFEHIENYFDGSMTPKEMEEFEGLVNNNPELKAEFDFQNDLIQAIKETRKTELKAQLNNVQIPPASTTAGIASKIISAAVIVGGIGYGIYYFNSVTVPDFGSNDLNEINQESSEAEEIITEQASPQEKSVSEPVDNPDVEKTEKITQSPAPLTPQIIEDFTDEEETDHLEMPREDLSTSVRRVATGINVEIKEDPKFNFHYKFEEDNLFLYGTFNEEIYEILEIKDGNSGGLFLYFKEKFYRLTKENQKIVPLEEITDQVTNRRLEEIKNK